MRKFKDMNKTSQDMVALSAGLMIGLATGIIAIGSEWAKEDKKHKKEVSDLNEKIRDYDVEIRQLQAALDIYRHEVPKENCFDVFRDKTTEDNDFEDTADK